MPQRRPLVDTVLGVSIGDTGK